MATNSLHADVINFLSTRNINSGETVEYGWFIFQVVVRDSQFALETLDFREIASFTPDFTEVERIHREQMSVLASEIVRPSWCTLGDAAIVSQSYSPGHNHAFLHRLDEAAGNRSGWYVGVTDDPLDVNDPANLHLTSLYELSIHDMRFVPYWLLPVGYVVKFAGDQRHLERP